MGSYETKKINTNNKYLTHEDGIPNIFIDGINNHWFKKDSKVMSFILNDYNTSSWIQLGYSLINELNKSNLMGFALDGAISNEYRQWLCTLEMNIKEGIIELHEEYRRHIFNSNVGISDINFLTIQNIKDALWPKEIWNISQPETYNGCDLLIAFYKEDIFEKIREKQILKSIDQFMETLIYATAWMIPLDGNIGFIVGN